MLLLRDVARLGIASKLSLLSPYTTSRSFSSRFGFTLSPILGVEPERTQSEGRANPERRHGVLSGVINCGVIFLGAYYSYTKKGQNKGAVFEKKNRHKSALDNNNNNNNNRDAYTIPLGGMN